MFPRKSSPAQSPLARAAGEFALPSTLMALDSPSLPRTKPPGSDRHDSQGEREARSLQPAASEPSGPASAVDDSRRRRSDTRFAADRDSDRGIAISTNVMAIVGDAAAGVLLSQVIYWTRRGVSTADRDGWIYKTAAEWQEETGMTWKVQRRARQILERLDLLEERKRTMPARLEFRLNLAALGRYLAERSEIEIGQLDLATFVDLDASIAEQLFGRGFLFRCAIARAFPLPTAMMCSRLLAGVRLPTTQSAGGQGGTTRLVVMPRERWRLETGLTRDQWQTARRNLAEAGVLVERRRNYPRRIDLAIDLGRLAAALAAARAGWLRDKAGLDWAKQLGGNEHRPIPPAVLPNPAFRDRPILPIEIAQSRLYLEADDLLHPQHPRVTPPAPLFGAFGCGGWWSGSGYSGQRQAITSASPTPASADPAAVVAAGEPERQDPAVTDPASPPAVAQGTLQWPRVFTEGDRELAARHLAGLDREKQQLVLDEIDWMNRSPKPVRSPVALARTLVKQVAADRFVPEGAHRVAAERAAAEAEAQQRRVAFERSQAGASDTEAKPAMTPEAEAARQRLNEVVDRMRLGRTA